MKKVVNAIINNKEGKILLIKRKGGIHSGKWAFPGGIIKKGETNEEALNREILEETGLKIKKILKKIADYKYKRKNLEITKGTSYLVQVEKFEVTISTKEISSFKWVDLEEIKKLDCVPGIKEEVILASN